MTAENIGNCLWNKCLRIVLCLLIFVCVFDPADKLFHLKVPLFVLSCVLCILDRLESDQRMNVPMGMLIYLFLFIFVIPLTSMAYCFFTGGDSGSFDGYQYFKSYLFLTALFVMYVSKIDLVKPATIILFLLAIVTLLAYVLSLVDSSLFYSLGIALGNYGIVGVGIREYGGQQFPEIYFHTSQMLVFPLGYLSKAVIDSKGSKKMLYGILLAINIVAMFFGGTRNNMFVSILTPVFVIWWYSKRKMLVLSVVLPLLSLLIISQFDIIQNMFATDEASNAIKVNFTKEYMELFSDPRVLLFGQGLGSSFITSFRGAVTLTELTYFEFIRRFGLVLSSVIFIMLFYPISRLWSKRYLACHYVFISYMFYLIMSFSNPFIVSSSGMLILSIVLYKTFVPPTIPEIEGECPVLAVT